LSKTHPSRLEGGGGLRNTGSEDIMKGGKQGKLPRDIEKEKRGAALGGHNGRPRTGMGRRGGKGDKGELGKGAAIEAIKALLADEFSNMPSLCKNLGALI